ncbi:hypothetical protein Hypma_005186, partial [Hypsizygus marmoreus]
TPTQYSARYMTLRQDPIHISVSETLCLLTCFPQQTRHLDMYHDGVGMMAGEMKCAPSKCMMFGSSLEGIPWLRRDRSNVLNAMHGPPGYRNPVCRRGIFQNQLNPTSTSTSMVWSSPFYIAPCALR